MNADASLPAPGWYPDPEIVGTQRYWDGGRWTDHRAPLEIAGRPAAASDGLVVAGYVTALLLPLVGFIIGIVLLAKDRTGHGLGAILLSIFAFWVIWPTFILSTPFWI